MVVDQFGKTAERGCVASTSRSAPFKLIHHQILFCLGRRYDLFPSALWQTISIGSFNFSKPSEQNNAENLLVMADAALAVKYLQNWKEHAAHSDEYSGR